MDSEHDQQRIQRRTSPAGCIDARARHNHKEQQKRNGIIELRGLGKNVADERDSRKQGPKQIRSRQRDVPMALPVNLNGKYRKPQKKACETNRIAEQGPKERIDKHKEIGDEEAPIGGALRIGFACLWPSIKP